MSSIFFEIPILWYAFFFHLNVYRAVWMCHIDILFIVVYKAREELKKNKHHNKR